MNKIVSFVGVSALAASSALATYYLINHKKNMLDVIIEEIETMK